MPKETEIAAKHREAKNICSMKINYLHVPAIYNPKIFELNDDILLQYEIEEQEGTVMSLQFIQTSFDKITSV